MATRSSKKAPSVSVLEVGLVIAVIALVIGTLLLAVAV
jgi:hypothetical protein